MCHCLLWKFQEISICLSFSRSLLFIHRIAFLQASKHNLVNTIEFVPTLSYTSALVNRFANQQHSLWLRMWVCVCLGPQFEPIIQIKIDSKYLAVWIWMKWIKYHAYLWSFRRSLAQIMWFRPSKTLEYVVQIASKMPLSFAKHIWNRDRWEMNTHTQTHTHMSVLNELVTSYPP